MCPNCGTENPDGAKFCNECASALTASRQERATERKVVSVLFCDLVGFTSRSEAADPEDVLATIRPYHNLLRAEIEGFGGTVEKFIGDAVMAVFGAPVAHEDDAERAVRAGLRILESLDGLNDEDGLDLSVRIGINSGDAIVALGARPEQGEGIVTGDVVNTAARIQTGAPINGIAVGAATYRTTKDIFEYQELEPIAAKGKAEPVPVWRAVAAVGRFGTDFTRTHKTPLVGRDVERRLLEGLFERAVRDRSCQLVTIVGEPGVGKSRMVAELFTFIDQERTELITWRQGRCLPYGDGIAFWALGEIVKAHAGILESDSVEEARVKLAVALRATGSVDTSEQEWLLSRLAPLVGAESTGKAEQEESFTAWRRFLEVMAGSEPVVYVFEDLHWADPAMLEFIEHLADWSEGVPMLLLGTARPELSETHPTWAAGLRNATRMNLAPLSAEDTAMLISELLGRAVLPVDVQAPILERAGGNPLYAEEFIRMLQDRGLLEQMGRTWRLTNVGEIPFPDSVQGLIAARLDTLPPEHKSLLHDASVIGKVFWAGALASISGRDESGIREALHDLSRREFVRPDRGSSMVGESEYAFWHLLIRDVAYGQIPRAERISKHRSAASWIETTAGERSEDLADVLAYHYAEALDLASATGAETSELAELALRFLVLAGDRAADLDPVRAQVSYEKALALAPKTHPLRPSIQLALGKAAFITSEYGRARELLEEAIAGFEARGEAARVADAKVQLYQVVRSIEPSPAVVALLDEAIATLEALPPGEELVEAYAMRAGWGYVADIHDDVFLFAGKSLSLADELNLPASPTALRTRGGVRSFTGDLGGVDELQRSIDLATQAGLMREAAIGRNELTNVLAVARGTEDALRELNEGIALARRCGLREMELFMEASAQLELFFDLGRWDDVLAVSKKLLAPEGDQLDPQSRLFCRVVAADVAIWRGDRTLAEELTTGLDREALATGEAQLVVSALDVVAHKHRTWGDDEQAAEALEQIGSMTHAKSAWNYTSYLPEIVRLSCAVQGVDIAERFTVGIPPSVMERFKVAMTMVEAELAEARGDLSRAAELYGSADEGWRKFSIPERAQALLGRGRCLVELGDRTSIDPLREARDMFASLGAERSVADVDALLEVALRLSS